MPTSNLKLFDENKANMLSDEEYNTNIQRLNGVQTGVASSSLQNKTLYQTSLVAYAIGQLMIANGKDATDSAAVSTFVANMDATMLQKVKDIATTEEAQQGLLNSKYMTPALTKVAIEYMLAHDITLGGSLTLHSDPTTGLQAATKNYVDTTIASKVVKEKIYDSGKIHFQSTDRRPEYSFMLPAGTNLNYQKLLFETVIYSGSKFKNNSSNVRIFMGFDFVNSDIGYCNLADVDPSSPEVNYKNDIHDYLFTNSQYLVEISSGDSVERSYINFRKGNGIYTAIQVNDYTKITKNSTLICYYRNLFSTNIDVSIDANIQLIIYGIN